MADKQTTESKTDKIVKTLAENGIPCSQNFTKDLGPSSLIFSHTFGLLQVVTSVGWTSTIGSMVKTWHKCRRMAPLRIHYCYMLGLSAEKIGTVVALCKGLNILPFSTIEMLIADIRKSSEGTIKKYSSKYPDLSLPPDRKEELRKFLSWQPVYKTYAHTKKEQYPFPFEFGPFMHGDNYSVMLSEKLGKTVVCSNLMEALKEIAKYAVAIFGLSLYILFLD